MNALNLRERVARWLHQRPAQPIVPDYVVERVGRGAALLDAQKPGWWVVVAEDHVDLTSDRMCVLGQVYGSFSRGFEALKPHLGYRPAGHTQMVWHGFSVERLPDLPLFKAEWGRVIGERWTAEYAATGR